MIVLLAVPGVQGAVGVICYWIGLAPHDNFLEIVIFLDQLVCWQ